MQSGKSLKDQGKSRTSYTVPREHAESQSLKDQGKSRTSAARTSRGPSRSRNPLKIRASLGQALRRELNLPPVSQSLKDQGKSRT